MAKMSPPTNAERAWDPNASLDEARAWLLEASAGTGKTYQLSTLYVRLVAERHLDVRRILAITFTEAATAELRDRVRLRLRETLDALDAGGGKNEYATSLVARGLASSARLHLEIALRDFDQAAISTIHGFSYRTLQELAFEAGQELDLELLADRGPILEQIVDDALATVYADADADEVIQLRRAGWTRDNLLSTAKAISGATAPDVEPAGVTLPGERAKLRAWLQSLYDTYERWTDDAGRAAREQLIEDASYLFKPGSTFSNWPDGIEAWLRMGAPCTELHNPKYTALRNIREEWLRTKWGILNRKGDRDPLAPPIETRTWWGLITALEAFIAHTHEFFRGFTPVAAFAATVREKYEGELTQRGLLSFDAMLSRLATAISPDAPSGALVRDGLRNRYDAVFVDEFQDTDHAQWNVLREAFLTPGKHLFLIGDPKQAIYGFRGADVNVYLHAIDALPHETRRTMIENHRSDPASVAAMNELWREGSGAFDVAQIDYVKVAPKKAERLSNPLPGFEVRWVDARICGGEAGARIGRAEVRRCAALAADEAFAWLSNQRSSLLAETEERTPREPLPGDLAVLVNDHHEAKSVRVELRRRGIPSVAASKKTVFDSQVATWLATWLAAVASGGRDREARAAALTPLAGWTPTELAWSLAIAERGSVASAEAASAHVELGPERSWDGWTQRFSAAAERWKRRGFAHTLDVELAALDSWSRILARPGGERDATDLRHLIELLHAEERARRLGPASLAQWLSSPRDAAPDALAQRLESDANAVRVETIHVSKGLEYPVVLLPFSWKVRGGDKHRYDPLTLRSASAAGVTAEGDAPARVSHHRLDLRAPFDPARAQALSALERETQQEELRKLYVGLTRARHHTVAWWGVIGKDHQHTGQSALGRLLMRDPEQRGFEDCEITFGKDAGESPTPFARVSEKLDVLCRRAHDHIAWSPATMPTPPLARWTPPRVDALVTDWPAGRALPVFSGRYGVSSYSSLARGAAAADLDEKKRAGLTTASEEPAAPISEDPEPMTAVATGENERDAEGGAAVGVSAPASVPNHDDVLLLTAGSGTRFGTFVHEVFERLDFPTGAPHSDDACDSLDTLLESLGTRHGYARDSRESTQLRAAIPQILRTPLGSTKAQRTFGLEGLPSDFTLEQLSRADRLDELPFDLALGAGTTYVRAKASSERYDTLTARPGCVDPVAVYDALAGAGHDPLLKPWLDFQAQRRGQKKALIGSIAGILTGSIDLAFRVGETQESTRYFVADYKTNRIEGCEAGHFTGPWLDWKMQTSGYLLQSLLYTLALHRHLRLRWNRYDYDAHFGGALYLFARGMVGPHTTRCVTTGHALGVHALRWPKSVVERLDEALTPPGNPDAKETR
jgi:exodeoxyribonuclease V beta subunit